MKTSESTKELSAALSAFQGGVRQPDRNRSVTVRTKTGGSYDFRYATFDHILNCVQDPLAKSGLAVLQTIGRDEHGLTLTTRLIHKSGEYVEDTMPVLVGQDKSPQAIGSSLTYSKRYSYCAILGIAAEEDDDANAAEGNQVEVRKNGNGIKTAKPSLAPGMKQVGEALADPFSMET